MQDFIINNVYIDALTGHHFIVRQLKEVGGNRGLFLADDQPKIKKGTKVCMYSRSLKVATPSCELNGIKYYNPVGLDGQPACSYAVQISKNLVVEPSQLTPDIEMNKCYNLGILINGAMKEDIHRSKPNTSLKVSNSKLNGPRVSLWASKDIKPSEEIILAYGAEMLKWIRTSNNNI